MIESGNYKAVVSNLLEAKGLNYGSLPKGLLKFHRYATNNRTAMEEHLTEGALYAASSDGEVNIHFTVSHEHLADFKALVAKKKADYERRYGVRYHISFPSKSLLPILLRSMRITSRSERMAGRCSVRGDMGL